MWQRIQRYRVKRAAGKARQKRIRKAPERSLPLRRLTFAGQVISLLALGYVSHLWPVGLLAALLLTLGHVYAFRSCARPNRIGRFIIFIGFHLLIAWLIIGFMIGAPYPQLQLSMLAMGAVSFDLRTRLNLYSGFGFAFINIYAAATLSRDFVYGLFLFAFLGILLTFLWTADSEDGTKDNPIILRPSTRARRSFTLHPFKWVSRFAAVTIIATPLLFLFTPRYTSISPLPPVTFHVPVRGQATSSVVNPALPVVQIQGWSNESSDYYFGFDNQLDLSYRGGLNDSLMMYVRSPVWSYWRSHAYDFYNGRTWVQTGKDEIEILKPSPGAEFIYYLRDDWPGYNEIFSISFFVVQPLPNLVFTGGDPYDLIIAAEQVTRDSNDGLRVGEPLNPGMSYSILAAPINFSPDALQAAGTNYPPQIRERFLQLPHTVTDRTRQLARDLAQDALTPYDKVVAIRDHLLTGYPYDYFPPPLGPGNDAVDQFLFEDKRGFCEMYVTSMVVMLRELGIPARLTAGFGSGDYNPITGYYEVRAHHAHAWTEVYFPDLGWVPFDPTPGWTGDPQTGPAQSWIFSNLAQQINLPSIQLAPAMQAGTAAFSFISGVLPVAGILTVTAVLLYFLWQGIRRWWAKRPSRYTRMHIHPGRRAIFRAYWWAQWRLRRRRRPAQTAQEYSQTYQHTHPELAELADAVDIAAYRPQPPENSLVARMKAWRRGR